nr:LysR substrate-binding domain-containing protein [uncultured Desulfobulbus sp.]
MERSALRLQAQMCGKDKQLSGTIRIGTPDGLGNCFLAPRFGELQRQNPELEVELIAVPMY